MSKLQPFHFSSVEELIEFLPEDEKKTVVALRRIILDTIPNCTEKLTYNVPYYYRNTRICFIWPSSVPWGNVKMNGVLLGFCHGHLLHDELDYLEKKDRKMVYTKNFNADNEIDAALIKTYLFDAVEIDKKFSNKHDIHRSETEKKNISS